MSSTCAQKLLAAASAVALMLAAPALTLCAAGQRDSNAQPNEVLLLDNLGRVVHVPTNELHHALLPSPRIGLKQQTPDPIEGMEVPEEVLRRTQEARAEEAGIQFFPATPPHLMPYLASFDEHGNTALRPGALVPFVPLDPFVQDGKYLASDYGLRYSFRQSLTYVSMSDVMKGDNSQGFYTFDLKAKWAVFNARDAGTAGWISTQVEAKTGLGPAGGDQSPKSNLGSLTAPNYNWSSVNGGRVPELAWQQSLVNGEVVVVAGMVSQRNYLDGNTPAHTAYSEFMNTGLVHSQVLPLSEYNFGLNLQWQPVDEWYAMAGGSAGDAPAGNAPWADFTWQHWSVVGELGYAPKDFLGLGSGVYRVQPFVAQADGLTEGGLYFNIQQQLGAKSPLMWFGRFGFGGSDVTSDADRQIGTGFVMQAPLMHAGLVPRLSNDLLGIGFVWSEPSATTKTVYHENEYTAETFYTLQLTPTIKLQPDFQVVWDRAFDKDGRPATVTQIQLVLAW